jgi:hypothetical protein
VKHLVRSRFWVESVLAFIAALLAFVTVLWPDWIERVFGIDPDRHSGSIEWVLVLVLVAAATLFTALARREWYRASLH